MSTNQATKFKPQKKSTIALLCLIAMLAIGDLDYITGYQIILMLVYILPIGFATIYVGPAFAMLVAFLSVAISVASDVWAGIPKPEMPIMVLNAGIALAVFVISIGLLHALKARLPQRE